MNSAVHPEKTPRNKLADCSSPYLQQHAGNPVHWYPWGEEAWTKARSENKLVLVSIGYSACHWCHVMEKESFEDDEVARQMNRGFVCIKVDREERPDVDHVYMEAVQAMSRQGGWPLNCFTTPDGLPVYGGTYYPRAQWMRVMKELANLWQDSPEEVKDYGQRLKQGLELSGALAALDSDRSPDLRSLHEALDNAKSRFDMVQGGTEGAPKFPLPGLIRFLMRYALSSGDEQYRRFAELQLERMSRGGICDQIGGGFARYSVDAQWKVPHFEKMLYDNAQLLDCYAEAYALYGKREYAETAKGILRWLQREMRHEQGGYYSALDADSEGEEGKFYTWSQEELEQDETAMKHFAQWYHLDAKGSWEGKYIPLCKTSFAEAAQQAQCSEDEAVEAWNEANDYLLTVRSRRVAPGLDDKSICSWNAMLAGALAKASTMLPEAKALLAEAIAVMDFVNREMNAHGEGPLLHSWKEGQGGAQAFLEDYAHCIRAYIELYKASCDEHFLQLAKNLTLQAIDACYDADKGIFFFTSSEQSDLIVRPTELNDNVIPSSNAVMAHNLMDLYAYFGLSHFRDKALRLLQGVEKATLDHPEGYFRWAEIYLDLSLGMPEVAISGNKAIEWYQALRGQFPLLFRWAASRGESELSLLQGRFAAGESRIYICEKQACKQPLDSPERAAAEMEEMIASWQKSS